MKRRRKNKRREKMIMLASSLFVLSALTMTGVYVKERNQTDDDGYVVDFSALEKQTLEKAEKIGESTIREEDAASVTSGQVKKDGILPSEERKQLADAIKEDDLTFLDEIWDSEETAKPEFFEETPTLSFGEKEVLNWPIVGNVLINYSMERSVYFPTLQQYKYNPAIIIEAAEGAAITAAADGKIEKIAKEEQTGNTVYMDIGNGYEVIYGQLSDLQVKEGDYVKAGDFIAKVATPTKYYSVEGCNVYFALKKDGEPIDPMTRL